MEKSITGVCVCKVVYIIEKAYYKLIFFLCFNMRCDCEENKKK